MQISIASDHGGLKLKNEIISFLTSEGHQVKDCGTYTDESCDYPDFAYKAAKELSSNHVERAIVVCTTGIGVSIVANKVKGVRCALVNNVDDARLSREHNNSNCLALGAKRVDFELAKQIISVWLNTSFSNEERHQRRVNKIKVIEEKENE